jgi:hypothetical protein
MVSWEKKALFEVGCCCLVWALGGVFFLVSLWCRISSAASHFPHGGRFFSAKPIVTYNLLLAYYSS